LEGYPFGRVSGKTYTRAELTGMIKRWIILQRMGLYTVSPKSLKLFVAGYGNASKEDVIKAVASNYDYHTNSNDLADAYALAKFGLAVILDKEPIKCQCAYDGQDYILR